MSGLIDLLITEHALHLLREDAGQLVIETYLCKVVREVTQEEAATWHHMVVHHAGGRSLGRAAGGPRDGDPVRLIDANALVEAFEEAWPSVATIQMYDARDLVEAAPVVHCESCLYLVAHHAKDKVIDHKCLQLGRRMLPGWGCSLWEARP